jgi:GNAT superfamily N-acetyltransferase
MRPDWHRSGEPISSPAAADWEFFEEWSTLAGWDVPAVELQLYRQELAGSAFVLHGAQWRPLGFVTVCRHQQHSAWVGNLIVDPARRREGYGRRLFEQALVCLAERGPASLWLTASPGGLPLYASCGFHEIGRVERWRYGRDRARPVSAPGIGNGALPPLLRADTAAWGHSRAELLTLLARGGEILMSGGSVALLQGGRGLRVLGPWLSADRCPRANRAILMMAVDALAADDKIAVDLIGGSPMRELLRTTGFCQTGESVLMLRGAPGTVKFDEIVALASLGSMG